MEKVDETFIGREARKSVWNPEEPEVGLRAHQFQPTFLFSVSLSTSVFPSEVAQLNFCSLSQKKSLYFLLLTQTHGPLCLPYVKDILGILEIPCKYSLNPERRKKVAENEKLGCM